MRLELRIAVERLVYLDQIRKLVLASFGPATTPKARVKNSEVTTAVAAKLGKEPSPALGRDVLQAMRAHGWRCIRNADRHIWKGVRRL